jgi:hypothetical protein
MLFAFVISFLHVEVVVVFESGFLGAKQLVHCPIFVIPCRT